MAMSRRPSPSNRSTGRPSPRRAAPVRGADAAKRFYAELLGWDVEVWKPGEMDYPMISAKGSQHGGFGPAQGGAPSHWVGHVVVDDVSAAGKRAQGAGGTIVAGPMDIPEVG